MDYYTELQKKIEEAIQNQIPGSPDREWVDFYFKDTFSKVNISMTKPLSEPCRELVNRGGKRWRPMLMVLTEKAFNGTENSINLAPALEFVHTASLIHDDIEDQATERRGGKAIHLLYGTDTAINSGSWLYFHGGNVLNRYRCPPEEKNRITDCFFSNLEKLHLGQALDISWHRDSGFYPAEEEYLLMVSLKTGTLANMAGGLGAIAGKQEEKTVSECGAAFRMAGMGFQIIDDVINLKTGNPGKLRGDDIVEGKKSLPVILYANRHKGDKGTEKLTEIFKTAGKEGITSGAVEEGIKLLSGSGAIDEALEKGKKLIYESMEKIGSLFPPGEAKEAVVSMLEKMIPKNL